MAEQMDSECTQTRANLDHGIFWLGVERGHNFSLDVGIDEEVLPQRFASTYGFAHPRRSKAERSSGGTCSDASSAYSNRRSRICWGVALRRRHTCAIKLASPLARRSAKASESPSVNRNSKSWPARHSTEASWYCSRGAMPMGGSVAPSRCALASAPMRNAWGCPAFE